MSVTDRKRELTWWQVVVLAAIFGGLVLLASGCSHRERGSVVDARPYLEPTSAEEAYLRWLDVEAERGTPMPLDPEWCGEEER